MQLINRKPHRGITCAPFLRVLLVAVAVLSLGTVQRAQASIVIDFETEPALAAQPSTFSAAGPKQTYTKPGFYTVDGGVVIGNPTHLPAFAANGTPPNAYGTADIGDPSKLSTLTLDLPVTTEGAVSVSGVLFNGQTITEDYTVNYFSGANPLGGSSATLADNLSGGFFNFSFTSTIANPITKVTMTSPNTGTNGWDFFVDTLRVTTEAVPTQAIPEPSSLVLMVTGLALFGYCGWRRRKRGA